MCRNQKFSTGQVKTKSLVAFSYNNIKNIEMQIWKKLIFSLKKARW